MGSSPKSPKAPPDPRIAEEAAKREAIALGQMDAQKRARYGSGNTVLTGGARSRGTALTSRPGDDVITAEPGSTKYGKALAATKDPGLKDKVIKDVYGDGAGVFEGNLLFDTFAGSEVSKRKKEMLDAAGPESKRQYVAAQRQGRLGRYLARNRSLVGITKTEGAK